MSKLGALLLIAIMTAGCTSVDIRRVIELERDLGALESQFAHVRQWGADPAKLEIPPELGEEIESLAVYTPYLETAISIFPGCFLPGLGAHAIGDPEMGWQRLGEAYTGLGEFAAGTGLTAISLGAAAACARDGSSCCEGVFETFAMGVTYMVTGPAHYIGSWLGDVASTYGAREGLQVRVEALKRRYRKFLSDYYQYCREYSKRSR